MKVTKSLIKQFEIEQKEAGTATAIKNLLWQQAAQILKDLGVSRIRTSYRKS